MEESSRSGLVFRKVGHRWAGVITSSDSSFLERAPSDRAWSPPKCDTSNRIIQCLHNFAKMQKQTSQGRNPCSIVAIKSAGFHQKLP
jgi:hypothetical protein